MNGIIVAVQLFFTIVIGMYFFMKLKGNGDNEKAAEKANKLYAERINRMRHIHLSEPLTEIARPGGLEEVIGQEDGIRALRAALCSKNPQHVIIYGPPGVGKTAAARLILEEAKLNDETPFAKDAKFVETDATIMRFDERSIADPLIGSVHDPIYQGAGEYGDAGIPQPKEGAVSKAHGGILFVDEIGELPPGQMNRLLKVLEDRRVFFESAYYSEFNRKIPAYIHDIFQNGMPADFRLVGATTRKPNEIPEAIRSRCVEIYFSALTKENILKILKDACLRINMKTENGVIEYISDFVKNGRDGVKILQTIYNIINLEKRSIATVEDAKWVIKAGRYNKNTDKIIGISFVNPKNN